MKTVGSTVGSLTGDLKLVIGGATLELGRVTVPLVAENTTRRDSGDPTVTIGVKADLKEIRDVVQQLFSGVTP